jgi:DNA-binding NtrC family response regulator
MNARSKVLIVDDEQVLLFVLRTSLTRSGWYEVETASSGRDALDKARCTSYDLLLTDLKMPGMGGIELTRAMKELDASISVVWMTTHGCCEVRDEAAELGVCRCLDKPAKIGAIRRVVEEVLGLAGEQTVAVDP